MTEKELLKHIEELVKEHKEEHPKICLVLAIINMANGLGKMEELITVIGITGLNMLMGKTLDILKDKENEKDI